MGRKEGIETYTRSRLIGYAQLLQEIAQEYKAGQKRGGEPDEGCLTRSSLLLRAQERENQDIFAGFVMDTSKQLENLAGTEFAGSAVCERQKKRIVKLLKDEGISVLEFYRTSNRNGYLEIGMVVKSENRCYYDVMEIADLLSEITHKSMLPVGGHAYIHGEPIVVCFQEEAAYRIFGGFAKATKEGEEVSGDNYILREFGDGTYLAAIADGMGSGVLAGEDSERTLSLVEKYIESSLPLRDCIRACNELFFMNREEERTVSLDLMELNQYTGECHFYKCGASASYWIRHGQIHEIAADRQPLGLSPTPSEFDEVLYLESGDTVILLSDGIAEEFYENPEILRAGMERLKTENPTDLATGILELAVKAAGAIRDDMTVLVISLYQEDS